MTHQVLRIFIHHEDKKILDKTLPPIKLYRSATSRKLNNDYQVNFTQT